MRIVTWNVNSVRLRLPLVIRLLEELSPDVVCLQETKCPDDRFPHSEIVDAGYPHVVARGMKGYNGVAIISRRPFSSVTTLDWVGRDDSRHLSVLLEGGIELHTFYVPSGGNTPDPAVNDKFDHKLRFLDEMAGWFRANRPDGRNLVMTGDLNIAPLEHDVWSHRHMLKIVSHTPAETERLAKVRSSLHWIDTTRHVIPEPERVYSWWSYRARDWSASDRGLRLDHIWVTPDLEPRISGGFVHRAARGWERPSDHAPVVTDLA